jgi:DNA-binding transcriptional MerR regulator
MKIPDNKRYFRIGEVSRIIGVEPYVLRFWETEFPQIRPSRADSKQRTYQRKDLEIIMEIKRLLYDEKMTIEGAKQKLMAMMKRSVSEPIDPKDFIKNLKRELQDIVEELD